VHADVERSGRLAEHRDVAGVAAEPGDVVADPLERHLLILQALVAGPALGDEVGVAEEPEQAEPVVERDHDDAVVLGEELAGVEQPDVEERHRLLGRAVDVAAAVDPHHHRRVPGRGRRRPHVEVQAVLVVAREVLQRRVGELRAALAERGGVARRRPRRRLLGRLPAQIADRRLRVRDAEELQAGADHHALDVACRGRDPRGVGLVVAAAPGGESARREHTCTDQSSHIHGRLLECLAAMRAARAAGIAFCPAERHSMISDAPPISIARRWMSIRDRAADRSESHTVAAHRVERAARTGERQRATSRARSR
jgi:hypothetical protein